MKHVTRRVINIVVIIFLFSYLISNLVLSQLVSPLYFQLIKEDKNAVASFLSKTQRFPMFSYFFDLNKRIYGDSLEQEVFAEDNERKKTILKFESRLQKNPKSRDLLYNLYLLYNEGGNKTKAQEYLKKAKEIDPMVEK